MGSIRRKLFRFFWYRVVSVSVGVLCTCGLEVGELFEESGCDWGFRGGDIRTVFGRFEVAPGAKRDLLEDFIVYVVINERMRVRVASEKQREIPVQPLLRSHCLSQ